MSANTRIFEVHEEVKKELRQFQASDLWALA